MRAIPVSLEALIGDVCRQARLLAPQRTIACSSATAAALGDPDALKQTLLILLDNALKHSPAEAIIEVTGTASADEVSIAVRDGGPGIAKELHSQLFERFFRADAARSGGGAGLGLAIARALSEGQGGMIGVESRPGQGSTFTVTVPRAALDLSAASVTAG